MTRAQTEFAPAKVNLALHVTGRRDDGYHRLQSLVVFAGVGDRVVVEPADTPKLQITGPQAAALAPSPDNLVLRAAAWMGVGARITLEKVLPIASGIGGGSADAAAVLRLLMRAGHALPGDPLALGADVPVCLAGRPCIMAGVGEVVQPIAAPLPPAWLVLANPGVAVSTPDVFRALTRRDNPPMDPMPPARSLDDLAHWLARQRNDLEGPAIALAPVIAQVRAALAEATGCHLARMSGSGATCFGLFDGPDTAGAAEQRLRAAHPDWWVAAAPILA